MRSNGGEVALITGSGRRRVGNIIARQLAARGLSIALHYHRSHDEAAATVDQLRAQGAACEAFAADVTQEADVDAMFEQITQRFGRLDLLVTSSAIWSPQKLEAVRTEDLWRNFAVNTLGTFLCARRAGLIMVEQPQGGAIVTIGDWAIARPYPNHAAYFISKGAIPTLTRTLAVELALRNPRVRVNCIHPGPVLLAEDMSESDRQAIVESTLVKETDCPEAIAQAVLSLYDNPFITGTCLHVDGGRTIFAGETRRDRPI